MSKPYGSQSKSRKSIQDIPKDLKSSEIGTNIRTIKIKKELSEHDRILMSYESVFFVKKRNKNPFWLNRATERMCRDLNVRYHAYRDESSILLSNETAQVINVPPSQEKSVRIALSDAISEYEKFIVTDILPESIALSSALERSLQTAKIVTDDSELNFDTKFIRMAHSDSLVLKSIAYFLKSSLLSEDLQEFYIQQYILHKFGSNKSSIDKSVDLLLNATTKGNKTNEALTSAIKMMAIKFEKMMQRKG